MARTVLAIRIETDLVQDAINDLGRIHQLLTHRHGERFRTLERDVESFAAGGSPVCAPGHRDLGIGDRGEHIALVTPSAELLDLIARARALGVI